MLEEDRAWIHSVIVYYSQIKKSVDQPKEMSVSVGPNRLVFHTTASGDQYLVEEAGTGTISTQGPEKVSLIGYSLVESYRMVGVPLVFLDSKTKALAIVNPPTPQRVYLYTTEPQWVGDGPWPIFATGTSEDTISKVSDLIRIQASRRRLAGLTSLVEVSATCHETITRAAGEATRLLHEIDNNFTKLLADPPSNDRAAALTKEVATYGRIIAAVDKLLQVSSNINRFLNLPDDMPPITLDLLTREVQNHTSKNLTLLTPK